MSTSLAPAVIWSELPDVIEEKRKRGPVVNWPPPADKAAQDSEDSEDASAGTRAMIHVRRVRACHGDGICLWTGAGFPRFSPNTV